MIYTYGYLFYIPISLICIAFFAIYGYRKKLPLQYYLMSIIAIVYINGAVKNVFFPLIIEDIEEFHILNNINIRLSFANRSLYHDIYNILLVVPMGIGVQYVFDLKLRGRVVLITILASSFELIQLLLLFTIRPITTIFDCNDIVLNVLGGLIGLIIVGIFNHGISRIKRLSTSKTLLGYLYMVGKNCTEGKSSLSME